MQPEAHAGVAPIRRLATATPRQFPELSPEADAGAGRYRALFDAINDGFCFAVRLPGERVDFRYVETNPAFERLTGLKDAAGHTMRELVPAVEEDTMARYARVAEGGGTENFTAFGFDKEFAVEAVATGQPGEIAVLFRDVTTARCAETALRESEARFRLLGETAPIIIALADGDGNPTYVNPYWETFSGRTGEEYLAGAYRTALHPDDRKSSEAIWQGALSNETGFEMEFRARAADGSYRWIQTRGTPVRDAAGNVVSWVNIALDIDDLRRLQDRQSWLVAELQHRVRNILTVIRSIFQRTREMTQDADEVADHFKGRLDAMARTQVLATHNAARVVDLESLIRDELLSVGVRDGPETSISGPDVPLPFDMAEPIALAIHELTTNALKYGALRTSGAELDIRWDVNMNYGGQRRLDLYWTESGVPAVSVPPARKGFGRELIEEALPYRLDAKTDLKFAGNGVRCSISISLPGEGDGASLLKGIGWW